MLIDRPRLEALVAGATQLGDARADETLEVLGTEAHHRHKQDSARQLKQWNEWAKKSVAEGGKAAHSFSKLRVTRQARSGGTDVPLLTAGQGALKQLLEAWPPMWFGRFLVMKHLYPH